MSEHTVVIGAGPAGIATAISLHDRGVRPVVVDRAAEVASSWRGRYDRLKLNTGRQFSHLPGRPYPKGTPTFPSRDQVIEHFDVHARDAGVELGLNTEVTRVDTRGGGWRLETSTGDIDARHVVVATGRPAREVIALPLFHAPIRLADALAVRARRSFIGDLTEFGLPIPDEGPFDRLARLGAVPSLVDLAVIDAIRDRSIEVVAGVDALDGDGVRLADGSRLEPDAVICAGSAGARR